MSDPARESVAEAKARRGRNIALAIALVALVVLTFVVTITRLQGNVVRTF